MDRFRVVKSTLHGQDDRGIIADATPSQCIAMVWQLTLDSLEAIALVMQEVLWFSSEERIKMVEEYRKELLELMEKADIKAF